MSPASNTTAQRAKRLYLLDAAEVAALYDRPHFTDEERAYYFALTSTETTFMQTFTDAHGLADNRLFRISRALAPC